LAALVLPAGFLVALLLLAPMVLLFRISLNEYSPTEMMVEATTAANYLHAVGDPYYRSVLLTTLAVATGSTLLALTLGFPAAYWLARMESRWKSFATIVVLFPLLVGNVVRAAGWLALLGNGGAINSALLGLGLITAPLPLIYNAGAVVAGIVAVVLPYMVLTLAAVIESIPRQVEEAASNLGARSFTVFRRVVLPMAKGGIAATAVLCFIFSWTEFLFALTLTQTGIKTVPVVSSTFVTSTGTAWGNMAALGAAAMVPAFIFVLLVQKQLVRGLTLGSLKQ